MEDQVKSISFEQLLKYLFGELPEEEHLAVEQIVTEEEYYIDLLDHLMDFCDRENIHDRISLEKVIGQQREIIFDRIKKRTDTAEDSSDKEDYLPPTITPQPFLTITRKILLFVLLLSLAAGAYFLLKKEVPSSPPLPIDTRPRAELKDNNAQQIMADFSETETENLTFAGPETWESDLINKRFSAALKKLETKINADTKEDKSEYLFYAGVLHLYVKDGSKNKALSYLQEAEGYREDLPKYLIIAYAENNQWKSAKQLLDKHPNYQNFAGFLFDLSPEELATCLLYTSPSPRDS